MWAESGMKKGQRTRYVLGAAITIVLGLIFLGIQLMEYHGKNFGPSSHAYGSLFFTITGFHFAHVAVGRVGRLGGPGAGACGRGVWRRVAGL